VFGMKGGVGRCEEGNEQARCRRNRTRIAKNNDSANANANCMTTMQGPTSKPGRNKRDVKSKQMTTRKTRNMPCDRWK
jgi:hypothetical protein